MGDFPGCVLAYEWFSYENHYGDEPSVLRLRTMHLRGDTRVSSWKRWQILLFPVLCRWACWPWKLLLKLRLLLISAQRRIECAHVGIADLTGLVCSNALLVWIFVRKVNSCNHTEHGSGGASRGWLSFWLSWNRISSRQLPPSPCEPVPLLHGQRPSRFPVRWWSVWWVPAMSPCPDRHRFPEKPPRDGISARLKDGGWSWLKCGGSFQVQQDCLSEGWSLTQYSRHSWNHGGTTEVRIRDRKNQTDVTNFASNFRSLWGRKPSFNRTSWCLEIL